ncbi:hypothetical protein ABID39_001070 [Bartonella japonica]|uniref:Uncharacterized protein n=1 Tax=Bartonella japonica TaxID=357761 RepID=A0ABV2FPE8_9HYPH
MSFTRGFFAQPIFAKTPADTLMMAWKLDSIKTFNSAQLKNV